MKASLLLLSGATAVVLAACSPGGSNEVEHTGGVPGTGGQLQAGGSGGAASNGGTTTGGTTGAGGIAATGGVTSSGGSATGGSSSSGGAVGSGGQESGGTTAGGGATSVGGTRATGGLSASGGVGAGGSVVGSGGAGATGGSAGRDAGPDSARGGDGAGADRDTAPACPLAGACTEPDKAVTTGSGTHCCYTYENWVGSGSATMTLKTDGFSVNWTNNTQFVGREGVRPGSGDLVIEYNANFQPNGNSYLCVYGWTTDPLVEYYVVDGWGSWKPPGGSSLGTVTSDGGTYDIYKSTRTNQPSIKGTATFPQYWSVRQQKKTSGTIKLANHIAAWATKGMPMGTFYEVSMTVEGYQSSGTADVKFSIK